MIMKVLKKHLWRSVQSRSWGTHFCNPDDGQAKQHLGEILSAVEFMDRQSLDMVFSQQDWSKDPLENDYPYYVLVETSGSPEWIMI